MGAPETPDRRATLRRIGLLVGLGTALALPAKTAVDVFGPGLTGAPDLSARVVATAALEVLPLVAFAGALLLRPARYEVIYWLAPVWFGAFALSGVIPFVFLSPVGRRFSGPWLFPLVSVGLYALAAVILVSARPRKNGGSDRGGE